MALEAKEVLEFMGYKPEEIKDINDLKAKFDAEFVRTANINEETEPVKKILGKVFGTLENEIKKVAKAQDLEVDFDSEDLKGKKVNDKLKYVFSKYEEKNRTVFEDLAAKATVGNDEKVKDLEKKYESIKQKNKDLEGLLNNTKTEYEGFKEKAANTIKSVEIDVLKKDIFSKIKFKPDISDFEKKGYFATIQDQYDFDIDENKTLVAKDKKGSLIPSTKVTGTFKTPLEILEEEAIKGKLYQLNPDGGKPKPRTNTTFGGQQQPLPGAKPRIIAPRLG